MHIAPEKTKQSRFTAYWSYITLAILASAARALMRQMKSAVRVSVLALAAFAVLEETALARSYLSCLAKKVVIVDAPKGTTSSSAEENFGFWIDEPTKIVTFADGKKLNVRRFDDHWISAVSGDVSYELDRQNGNLTFAGSTMKGGIATTIIGAGRCTAATSAVGCVEKVSPRTSQIFQRGNLAGVMPQVSRNFRTRTTSSFGRSR